MSNGILGLGQGQAASLNSDLIEKLKAADKKATVDPLETKLEKFTSEKEAIANITTKVDALLNATKVFSLNQSSGVNAFNQKSASVMGDGVVFDSDDLSALQTGSLSVKVGQLAQKDAWQSNLFSGTTTKDTLVNKGNLVINGSLPAIDTEGMSYTKLVEEINKISGVQASLVENSAGGFRISIKSSETGEANKIKFTGSDAGILTYFGYDSVANNVLKAQDMTMKVDGIDYSSNTNTVTIDGLKITATKTDAESTINIENDTTTLANQMKDFANAYNDLRAEIENEIYSSESSIEDKSSLRDMLNIIKDNLFNSGNSESTIFSFGFSLDQTSGNLLFKEADFQNAIKNGTKDLENLFSGVPEKKGIATLIDEAISINGISKGLIDYELGILSREEAMKKEKETAEAALDSRYSIMAQQFASYGVIINQMEASFSGLKMMIQQSVASK